MEELEAFYSVYAMYLWAGLAAVVLLFGLWLLALQIQFGGFARHYRALTSGVEDGNLEDALARQVATVQEAGDRLNRLNADLETVQGELVAAIQRVGLVRFNPFGDTGGDQSFSVALLDAKGDGLVLSSLFGRSDTRVFAKPVQAGQSKYALSEEERHAIELATGTRNGRAKA